jgi:hypothetical protein
MQLTRRRVIKFIKISRYIIYEMGGQNSKSKSEKLPTITGSYVQMEYLPKIMTDCQFDDRIIQMCIKLDVDDEGTYVSARTQGYSKIHIKKFMYNGEEVVNYEIAICKENIE